MRLELPTITEEVSFFKSYIPKILKSKLKDLAEGQQTQVIKYLESNVGIKIAYDELVDEIVEDLTIMKNSDVYVYTFNTNRFIQDKINLEALVALINYGSLDLRGTNIFDKSFNYIKDNCQELYTKYRKGGK